MEEAPIVIEPILSNNIDDDIELKDSIFGLYSNDFLQEYFDARNMEIQLSKSDENSEELEELRKKIDKLDKEEEKVIYSSSDDKNSDEERINIEEESLLDIVEDTIIEKGEGIVNNLSNIDKKEKKKKKRKAKAKKG